MAAQTSVHGDPCQRAHQWREIFPHSASKQKSDNPLWDRLLASLLKALLQSELSVLLYINSVNCIVLNLELRTNIVPSGVGVGLRFTDPWHSLSVELFPFLKCMNSVLMNYHMIT